MAIAHRHLLVIVGLLALAAVGGIALLWPTGERMAEHVDADPQGPRELIDATIVDVETVGEVEDPGLPPGARSVVIVAELDERGERVVVPMVADTEDLYEPGDRVRLEEFPGLDEGDAPSYAVADFRRGPALLGLAALFGVAVLAFSRLQGARSLLGLAITFAVIIGFIVPAVLAGRSPLLVALAGSVTIMIATLYLSHGFTRKTTAAVVGTAGALAVTVALGALFVDLASLTGMTDEEARLANVQLGGISFRGLLLAGIIIGALGVLDDVTMSQASTVFALHRADPAAGFRRLVAGALAVGRDHVAATVNTLFLAYVGASLPLLILFVTGPVGVEEVLTGELVAVEVVRTLVGSLGLIAAVPVTTVLAAAVVRGEAAGTATARRASAADPVAAALGADHDAPPAPSPTGGAPPSTAAAADDAGADHATADEAAAAAAPADEDATEWEQRLREAYGLHDDPERRSGG